MLFFRWIFSFKRWAESLEALRFGCNIIHGNYTYNFKDVYKMLEKEKLSLKVSGSKGLGKKGFYPIQKKK